MDIYYESKNLQYLKYNIDSKYNNINFKSCLLEIELIYENELVYNKENFKKQILTKYIEKNMYDDSFMEDYFNYLNLSNNLIYENENDITSDIKNIEEFFKNNKDVEKIENNSTDVDSPDSSTMGMLFDTIKRSIVNISIFKIISSLFTTIPNLVTGQTTISAISATFVSSSQSLFAGLMGLLSTLTTPIGIFIVISIASSIFAGIIVAKKMKNIDNRIDVSKAKLIKYEETIKKGDELSKKTKNEEVIKKWNKQKQKIQSQLTKEKIKFRQLNIKINKK